MAQCVVLGGTGHVGRRLVPRLLAAGHRVRCLVRDPQRAAPLGEAGAELQIGDALDNNSVHAVMSSGTAAEIVYHLIHSLGAPDFAERDLLAAQLTAEAATAVDARQLVYLGGIASSAEKPGSEHLASRAHVGQVLLDCPVPTVALQASMIIGAGSASYEMLRYLVHRVPVMPATPLLDTRIQPIAVADVVHYLAACAALPRPLNRAVDIGGPEVLTYRDLIQRYARTVGLPQRMLVPVPTTLARLIGPVLDGLTPVPTNLAAPLMESLGEEMVVHDPGSDPLPPPPGGPTSLAAAIRASELVEPCSVPVVHTDAGPQQRDEWSVPARASAQRLWQVIEKIGGRQGWYRATPAMALRGLLDHLVGGVGLHRGRPDRLAPGETVDWWRVVEHDDRARRLVLVSELRAPGQLCLTMSAEPRRGGAVYRQELSAYLHGTLGHVYWTLQRPLYGAVFGVLAHAIARTAEREPPSPGS